MKLHTFTPNFTNLGNIFQDNEHNVTDDQIKNEPMLYSANMKFFQMHAGSLGRFVLDQLANITNPGVWKLLNESVIDSRSHMLMPGFWPCIPGWHHDDVPRTRGDGQPNYHNPEYRSQHLMVVIGKTAMTQFLRSSVVLPEIPEGRTVYQAWDRIIEASCMEADCFTVGNGDIYQFDWQTFHRGMPAKVHGWRYFVRFSWCTERRVLNEIRNQVQVYMNDPSIGW